MTDSSSSSPPSTGAASSSSQAGKGRPSRISKRRENKLAYHGIARYFNNHHAFPATATSSSRPGPDPHLSRFPVQIHQSSLSSSPTNDLGYENFFAFQDAVGHEIAAFEQHNHHGLPSASFPPSSLGSYTFHSIPSNSSLPPQSTPVSPLAAGPSQVSGNGLQCAPYTGAMDMFPSDSDSISAPGSRMGSFDSLDSFNSMALSLGTQASSVTEGFICPVTDSSFGSPRMDVINDLQLPGEYFQAGQIFDLNSSYNPAQMGSPQLNDAFPLDTEFMSAGWGAGNNIYEIGGGQWPSASLTHQQLMGNMEPLIPTELSQSPWSVERMPPNQTADPACVTFEPPPGIPLKILKAREEVLESKKPFGPDPPVSPMDDDGWEDIYMNVGSSYAGSSTVHDSPRSEGQSWLQIDSSPFNSPSPVQIAGQHIFTATNITGSASPKSRGGRTRALTPQEKQETLDVRKAKACWACHLSKIKCSPCSQGVSCQQCERLKGKRRFCLLTCFNDPLESLEAFVLPKYLTGHITQANVEQAVSQHGTSWGKQEILIRMDWGYEKLLEARVVALILPSQSQLGYQHQAVGPNFKRPELVRKKSPPLGIPLASFEDMKVEYRNMVRDIVMGDLESYVEVPYDNQESELPEHLLGIICTFYRAGLAAGQECELLREVIAIHVISTILERSLILDDDSLRRVEKHLNDSFPRPSAANCVQRQIKFALFLAQRERVSQVLEDWGHMMWSSSKGMNVEQKWATSFSVLVMLILVVDKMIEAADLFCRGEVQHHGADALAERHAFEELVRLTQRELFERCKEIFHSSFKTRKGGKEACNPIRDGLSAFRGRPVPEGISRLVWDLKNAHRVYGPEIRSQWTTRASIEGAEYGNAGRLASVFLGDFVSE